MPQGAGRAPPPGGFSPPRSGGCWRRCRTTAPRRFRSAPTRVRTAPRTRLTAVIVACALFMQNLDSTVIATALPTMAQAFGADPVHMNVALTSYLLSLAVFIPASGWMADRFGTRTVFRAAIVVFTVGSVAVRAGRQPGFPGRRARPAGHGRGDDGAGRAARAAAHRAEERAGRRDGLADDAGADRPGASARRSAASSSPISPGAGSSTSTCRSACSASCWSRCSSRTCARPPRGRFDALGAVVVGHRPVGPDVRAGDRRTRRLSAGRQRGDDRRRSDRRGLLPGPRARAARRRCSIWRCCGCRASRFRSAPGRCSASASARSRSCCR